MFVTFKGREEVFMMMMMMMMMERIKKNTV